MSETTQSATPASPIPRPAAPPAFSRTVFKIPNRIRLLRRIFPIAAPNAHPLPRRVIGWLADFCRLAWGLLYWNFAKTRFRLRGARGRCPCQSPSDSGRALETACEASLTWHRQERFQRVCPLLQRDAAGELRCSVNTADVRPFWGRAFAASAGTLVALYLFATAGYFSLQRAVGVPVSFLTVAYPPHWDRLDLDRSRYFTTRAERALASGQIGDAEKSLTLAYSLDSANYPAGFKLALLYQSAQPAVADRLFARLLHEHPAQRSVTATAWFQSLLLRADFPSIIPLATSALSFDPAHEAAWMNALLFALRRAPDGRPLNDLLAGTDLPAAPRQLLELELATRTLPPTTARNRLLSAQLTSPYSDYYRTARLIDLGFSADVLPLLRTASQLSARDRTALSLHAHASLGWESILDNTLNELLATPPSPTIYEVLAVHLIHHPHRARLDRVFATLARQPPPATDAGYSAALALLAAAGVNHEPAHIRAAAALVQKLASGRFRTLTQIEQFFLNPARDARIEFILPALQPLATEVNYALLARYHPARPATPSPAPARPAR